MSAFLRLFGPSLWLFIIALLLVGCGDSPRLSLLSEDATVLAFGDSLTAGMGVSAQESYPAVLARRLDINVLNAGVSGEVTADGTLRLKDLLNEFKPDLVIICHGGNDFLHRLPPEQIENNLRDMISLSQAMGVEVVLIGVPEPGIWGRAPGFYRRLAREFNVPLDDQILGQLETDPAMKSDPVHLNKPGYSQLADAVITLLVETGGLAK